MWLLVLFGIAAGVTLAIMLWPRWLEVQAETVAMVSAHQTYSVAHPGWSFPARVYSAPFDLDGQTPAMVVAQALARDYTEACPPKNPGEVCRKDGAVLPRGGVFPEGEQPPGKADWTRPLALEPVPLGVLLGPDAEVRWHLPVDEAPPTLIAAILAAEDEEFYEHPGVDFMGLARAVIANYQGGSFKQGASTLSMQVVRNLNQRKEKTVERKLLEMAAAIALDQHLGKEGVLQMYLDAPYLGQAGSLSICGFAAAAEFYYGRSIQDLTLSEYATLAGILPAPGKYAPNKNPDAARARRDLVLRRMAAAGWNIEGALAEAVVAGENPPLPPEQHPAYLQAARQWLEAALPPETLYGAGLTIFTAMDARAQVVGETLLPERIAYLQRIVGRRGAALETATALVDARTGHLLAVYGGTMATSTDFNRATQARRQPGSSFKPMVYALAFSVLDPATGLPKWRAHDTVANNRHTFPGTDGWTPRNISGDYSSTSTLAMGMAWSQNVATASLLEASGGPKALISFAEKMGYETSKLPAEMGLALGQGEVSPLEQARFVATVINGGQRATGSPIVRATNAGGVVLIDAPMSLGERVLTPEGAALTRDLMRLVIEYGTGGASRGGGGFPGFQGPSIGKTGTTDLEKDLWFIGGSPFYAGALWLGYDQPERIGGSASDLAAPLWGWWMRALHEPLPRAEFEDTLSLKHRAVCTMTGKYSNGTCRLIGAPFLEGDAPKGACNISHPPPDPEAKKHEGLWKRRHRESEERAAAEAAEAAETGGGDDGGEGDVGGE